MATIKEFLTQDHRSCDDGFAAAEEAVNNSSGDALALTQAFIDALYHHLDMEEKVLFPAFEAKTGMVQGPTAVMRMEHAQMRRLCEDLITAVEDKERYFGISETLMILMQQHNMKEEQMLYAMAQQHLAADADRLIEAMQAV